MTDETIQQLVELKNLYEKGILTKEEVEAEKAKILGTHGDTQAEVAEQRAENQASTHAEPHSDGNVQPTPNNAMPQQPDNNKTMKWVFGIIIAILLILILALILTHSNSNDPETEDSEVLCDSTEPYYYDEYENDDPVSDYSDQDEYSESEQPGGNEGDFEVWIKLTYGDNRYFSSNFVHAMNRLIDCGGNPEQVLSPFWSSTVGENMSITGVDLSSSSVAYAYVDIAGQEMTIQFVKENGEWAYDDFIVDGESFVKTLF